MSPELSGVLALLRAWQFANVTDLFVINRLPDCRQLRVLSAVRKLRAFRDHDLKAAAYALINTEPVTGLPL